MTSPTQGEKPAEAREAVARVLAKQSGSDGEDWYSYREEADEILAAISSPQEGATAVGGYTAEQMAEARRCLRNDSDKRFQIADDVIESLQRQVEEWKDACQAYSNTVTRLNERAETAESSLRTLGDALERAREALRLARPFVRDAGSDEDPDAARGALEAEAAIDAALTPPTRDTSCEAVAKREPSLEQQLSDARAAIHSPHRIHTEVYDGLVDPAEAEYLARHYPPDKGADE